MCRNSENCQLVSTILLPLVYIVNYVQPDSAMSNHEPYIISLVSGFLMFLFGIDLKFLQLYWLRAFTMPILNFCGNARSYAVCILLLFSFVFRTFFSRHFSLGFTFRRRCLKCVFLNSSLVVSKISLFPAFRIFAFFKIRCNTLSQYTLI